MSSEALGKTVITGNWQIFSKKLFQHFIHHNKISKVTKFQFKIFAVEEFSIKIYPCGTLSPPSPSLVLIGLTHGKNQEATAQCLCVKTGCTCLNKTSCK